MSLIDFKSVSDELDEADVMHVMQVLVRPHLLHGADNRPAVAVLTDKVIYLGGTEDVKKRFERIPLKSITSCKRRGALIWECIMVKYIGLEGEQKLYLCPFEGHHSTPKKDNESMELLLKYLKKGESTNK